MPGNKYEWVCTFLKRIISGSISVRTYCGPLKVVITGDVRPVGTRKHASLKHLSSSDGRWSDGRN